MVVALLFLFLPQGYYHYQGLDLHNLDAAQGGRRAPTEPYRNTVKVGAQRPILAFARTGSAMRQI